MERDEGHEALKRMGTAVPPEEVRQRILVRAAAGTSPRTRVRERPWAPWAAAGALAVGLAVGTLLLPRWSPPPRPAARWVATVDAPQVLDLGPHRVEMAADSRLAVAPGNGSGIQLRLVKGQVDCQVEPLRSGQRFVVHTAQARITVMGTQFQVRAWKDCTEVRVREGRVEVAADEARPQVLGPGQTHRVCDAPPADPPATDRPATERPDGSALMQKALRRLAAGDVKSARQALEAYRRLHPDGIFLQDSLFHQGRLEAQEGNLDRARDLLDALRQRFPDSPRVKALEQRLQK